MKELFKLVNVRPKYSSLCEGMSQILQKGRFVKYSYLRKYELLNPIIHYSRCFHTDVCSK